MALSRPATKDKLKQYASVLGLTISGHVVDGLVVRLGHELSANGPFVFTVHDDDELRLIGVALQMRADLRQGLTAGRADMERRRCEAAVRGDLPQASSFQQQ
jgi:hypothetical protein